MVFLIAALIAITIYFLLRHFCLLPPKSGLRVLMYHHIDELREDGLTVSKVQLAEQLKWLKASGYTLITPEVFLAGIDNRTSWPSKPVLITFDDAYKDFETTALPVLKDFEVKALVFVPTAFAGKVNEWDQGQEPILSLDEMASISDAAWGFHSHQHINYREASPSELDTDLGEMQLTVCDQPIHFLPLFAYPYGAYPLDRQAINKILSVGMKACFRIGNRINKLPIKNMALIQRIDVRGDQSFNRFKRNICYGK